MTTSRRRDDWREECGADLQSDDARDALQDMRTGYSDDMRSLLDKYGVDVPEGAGPGFRSGQGGGVMGGGNGGGTGQGMGQCGGTGSSVTD